MKRKILTTDTKEQFHGGNIYLASGRARYKILSPISFILSPSSPMKSVEKENLSLKVFLIISLIILRNFAGYLAWIRQRFVSP
jgi:hypothetical protein